MPWEANFFFEGSALVREVKPPSLPYLRRCTREVAVMHQYKTVHRLLGLTIFGSTVCGAN